MVCHDKPVPPSSHVLAGFFCLPGLVTCPQRHYGDHISWGQKIVLFSFTFLSSHSGFLSLLSQLLSGGCLPAALWHSILLSPLCVPNF